MKKEKILSLVFLKNFINFESNFDEILFLDKNSNLDKFKNFKGLVFFSENEIFENRIEEDGHNLKCFKQLENIFRINKDNEKEN